MGRPTIKTAEEIRCMRAAGRIASQVLRRAAEAAMPGMTTRELDAKVGGFIASHGAVSAFLGYRGFPGQCCLSVNEAVIHGIGDSRRLQFGDLLKIDVGVRHQGFIGDVAMTVMVGGGSTEFQKLLDTTVQALYEGISVARPGSRVMDIGRAVERCVSGGGYGVVREFCGHGVGRNVHEEPQVPNYVDPKAVTRLKSGMTIAIEPMVTLGSPAVEILGDGWTVVTRDRRVSAHFEHTVLITDSGPEILTRDEESRLY
ncbi:MAG: type I methionyl aminopeptidase [Verrucomicrobia bacterium]|nr:type I methionyl aminopeptidase [Verrucomicrobiota bacterium]